MGCEEWMSADGKQRSRAITDRRSRSGIDRYDYRSPIRLGTGRRDTVMLEKGCWGLGCTSREKLQSGSAGKGGNDGSTPTELAVGDASTKCRRPNHARTEKPAGDHVGGLAQAPLTTQSIAANKGHLQNVVRSNRFDWQTDEAQNE